MKFSLHKIKKNGNCHSMSYVVIFNPCFCDVEDMTSLLPCHHCNWSQRIPEFSFKGKCKKVPRLGYSGSYFSPNGSMFSLAQQPSVEPSPCSRRHGPVYSSSLGDGMDSENSEDEPNGESSTNDDQGEVIVVLFSCT